MIVITIVINITSIIYMNINYGLNITLIDISIINQLSI